MKIGLTGGIASGKTTVSNILKELGAELIDSDKIAHQVISKGNRGWKLVVEAFGKEILDNEGEINRSKLANIIFNDDRERKRLEEITHPLIIAEINRRMRNSTSKPVVLDAPLLYETGLDRLVDQVWVVYVDRSTQLERLMKRDKLSLKEAKARIDSQLSLEKKKRLADKVICNMGSRKDLREKVIKLWEEIL